MYTHTVYVSCTENMLQALTSKACTVYAQQYVHMYMYMYMCMYIQVSHASMHDVHVYMHMHMYMCAY